MGNTFALKSEGPVCLSRIWLPQRYLNIKGKLLTLQWHMRIRIGKPIHITAEAKKI